MENKGLMAFYYEGYQVRKLTIDDELWVVGKDVAEALGYSEATYSNVEKMTNHVPEEWKGRYPIPTPGGIQEMICLSEQGLYFFLGRSDKAAALPFQKWIAGEVVPAIRKQGFYATPKVMAELISRLERLETALQEFKEKLITEILPAYRKHGINWAALPKVWPHRGQMLNYPEWRAKKEEACFKRFPDASFEDFLASLHQ
jgi:prophage antirepressor-like protein